MVTIFCVNPRFHTCFQVSRVICIMAHNAVKLNVGGIPYVTTRATLTRYSDSMLGAMFSGKLPSTKDENGGYIIDRDGQLFWFVLNYLRCSKLALPADFNDMEQLEMEADFYQIQPLIDDLRIEREKGAPFDIIEMIEDVYVTEPARYPSERWLCIASNTNISRVLPAEVNGKLISVQRGIWIHVDCDVQLAFAAHLLKHGWSLTHTNTSVRHLPSDESGSHGKIIYTTAMTFKLRKNNSFSK